VWHAANYPGVLVEETASIVFSSVYGRLTAGGALANGLTINGQAWYATKPTIVRGGGGTDAVIGGTGKLFAAIPYVETKNNAMLVAKV
jgi:hypothetical protein